MGCWDAWCPICGLCFYSLSIDDFTIEFKKVIKKTKWMEKVTVLLPDKKARHGFIETSCNITFLHKIKKDDYYLDTMANGLALHTECWKLAKRQGIILKYEDFDYKRVKTHHSKHTFWKQYMFTYINYSPAKKYHSQYFDIEKLYKNPKDWYILYKPNNMNSHESKKNINRILKNVNQIKKNKPKIRPSPTITATIFKKGTEKKGNDGRIYVVKTTSNGTKRWILKNNKKKRKK